MSQREAEDMGIKLLKDPKSDGLDSLNHIGKPSQMWSKRV